MSAGGETGRDRKEERRMGRDEWNIFSVTGHLAHVRNEALADGDSLGEVWSRLAS